MTREEAIRLLDLNREYLKNTNNIGLKDDIEALEMAIKALEQGTTDRIEYGTDGNAYKLWISNGKEYEPKTGHWVDGLIAKVLEEVDGGTDDMYIRYTDICNRVEKSIREFCGARMVEQERGDKE